MFLASVSQCASLNHFFGSNIYEAIRFCIILLQSIPLCRCLIAEIF